MARHARLGDADLGHELPDRPLTVAERFDDASSGGVGQDVEHDGVYTYQCINRLSRAGARFP